MLSKHQLMISDFYNIPFGNVKKINFIETEKYVLHYENLQLYLKLRLKLTKKYYVLAFNLSQWLKINIKINKQKGIDAEKMVTRMKKHCTRS